MEIKHRNRERIETPINQFKKRESDSVRQVSGQVSRQSQGFDIKANMRQFDYEEGLGDKRKQRRCEFS